MKKVTRDVRQAESVDKWKKAGGSGIMLLPTGFGKTNVAIQIISRFKDKIPNFKAIVVVPTDYLQKQWVVRLAKEDCHNNTEVIIINTAMKRDLKCHLFVADEVHMFCGANSINIFDSITCNYFLGLTATLNRLDGREIHLLKKYKIVDHITLDEAIANKWVAPFKQYKVELNVDLEAYRVAHTQFLHHFAFFDYNFELAMSCLSDYSVRYKFHTVTGQPMKDIMLHAMNFMRKLHERKNFIYNHPNKIELANKIIRARPDDKIITFTKNTDHAKLICCGDIYHSKLSKKKRADVVAVFNAAEKGVLNTCKALDVGADVEGISLGVILSGDSSSITKRQKVGRAIRFKEGKVAEIFTMVIKGTAEEQWFLKSNKGLDFEVIQDYQLDDLLNGNEVQKSEIEEEFIFIL